MRAMGGPLITSKPFCFIAETVVSKSFFVTYPFGSITRDLPAGFIDSRTDSSYPLSGKTDTIPGNNSVTVSFILCR